MLQEWHGAGRKPQHRQNSSNITDLDSAAFLAEVFFGFLFVLFWGLCFLGFFLQEMAYWFSASCCPLLFLPRGKKGKEKWAGQDGWEHFYFSRTKCIWRFSIISLPGYASTTLMLGPVQYSSTREQTSCRAEELHFANHMTSHCTYCCHCSTPSPLPDKSASLWEAFFLAHNVHPNFPRLGLGGRGWVIREKI